MKITAYDSKKKERVTCGTLEGDVFYKVVKEQNFCDKHKTYGIQTEAIESARELGAAIVVIDGPEGIFESDIEQWFTKQAKREDSGSGEQIFLPLNKMR